MVTRGNDTGVSRLQDYGRRQHETHSRWISRAALAHDQRMGHHAFRVSTAYSHRLDGKSFVADVNKNDLWFFPPGLPHSIQGLNPDGCEFMLVFDDGNFSESATVLLSDTIGHVPPEVLAKNFAVDQQAFKNVPKEELFIFQADVPSSLEADQKAAAGTRGRSPQNLVFRTMEMPPTKKTKGGEVRVVDSSNFKVSTTAMAMVT